MNEPEAKLKAYKQRCMETCQWCAKGNTQDGHRHWSDGDWHKCTAPTESQFAEEMAQDLAFARKALEQSDQVLSIVSKERDQWHEKFELAAEVAKQHIEQLAARDQEIARLRKALQKARERLFIHQSPTSNAIVEECDAALAATAQPSSGPTKLELAQKIENLQGQPSRTIEQCPECKGRGVVVRGYIGGDDDEVEWNPCPKCSSPYRGRTAQPSAKEEGR